MRLSMQTNTGMEYFLGLTMEELIATVNDFVDIAHDIKEAREKAVKKRK